MRFLDEFRRRPALLADHLPWAVLIAPGVVLNKDGSFTTALRFRGPDMESATAGELAALRARLNNALKRLGRGWCLHVEAARRPAAAYDETTFDPPAAFLVDAERRRLFLAADPAFETDHRAALTWLPPADQARGLERWLMGRDGPWPRQGRHALALFRQEAAAILDLLADALPEAAPLDDAELLSWLHACVSPGGGPVDPEEAPVFLDALLADQPLTGGLEPRLGAQALKVVSVRGLPSATRPGLIEVLGELAFPLRWTCRWIALDRADAELEILKLRKRWFARRKGLGVLLREAVTREEIPLLDTDALAKTEECDAALEGLGAEACAFGYLTLTVALTDPDPGRCAEMARAVEALLNGRGLVARVEDLNAVEAWLGSLPGEAYADVRRPLVSTFNLADLLPAPAVWAGPPADPVLGAPLAHARTAGATPFRLVLHVGDVGHAMVVGPTGSGKSTLLAFFALQWLRYPGARVVFFDKGRSVRAATLACGGRWRDVSPGEDLSLQPLAGVDDAAERAWAADWLADALAAAGLPAPPARREEIWAALSTLAAAPADQRTLTVFRALLQDAEAALALEPFCLGGAHGGLLDGAGGDLPTSVFDTFELETLMATPRALGPVLGALFHRLEAGFDGRPTLLVLDEAWLFLDETRFAGQIRAWLKTLRKKRVAVVFATQSLDDVAASAIAASLIENCPTQVFLPNPRALEPASAALYRGFGLNARQLELLAYAPPKRAYYWCQPGGRRLFDLKLTGAALALCGAGSPEDQALIDEILAHTPAGGFARAFLKAKGLTHVDPLFDALEAPRA
jgi:type IV secretion system protein VirB4